VGGRITARVRQVGQQNLRAGRAAGPRRSRRPSRTACSAPLSTWAIRAVGGEQRRLGEHRTAGHCLELAAADERVGLLGDDGADALGPSSVLSNTRVPTRPRWSSNLLTYQGVSARWLSSWGWCAAVGVAPDGLQERVVGA